MELHGVIFFTRRLKKSMVSTRENWRTLQPADGCVGCAFAVLCWHFFGLLPKVCAERGAHLDALTLRLYQEHVFSPQKRYTYHPKTFLPSKTTRSLRFHRGMEESLWMQSYLGLDSSSSMHLLRNGSPRPKDGDTCNSIVLDGNFINLLIHRPSEADM